MIPYTSAAISMVVWGWISDHVGDRRWCLFTTCVISTIGLVVAGLTVETVWSLVGIVIAAIGFYGTKGPFWSYPSAHEDEAERSVRAALDIVEAMAELKMRSQNGNSPATLWARSRSGALCSHS